MRWEDGKLIVNPPKRPKKITGTRFAAILGYNVWSSPFTAWCEITRTWEKPFEDTKYTIAGKIIEPLQAAYIHDRYFIDVTSPTDVYGPDYFNKTYGDFFHDVKVFGGMWDYLLKDGKDTEAVFEMKTTKRSEDWQYDIPEYYALQAALYAYLLGVDRVYMVCSFLEEKDYDHPENYIPSPDNTIVRDFRLSERYPDFQKYVDAALAFWEKHVLTGISPEYDEKKDADALAALRKNSITPDTDIYDLIQEAESLMHEIDAVSEQIEASEKRLKALKDLIKTYLSQNFREGDNKVEIAGKGYVWTLSRSPTVTIDKDRLKEDGLLDKYSTTTQTERLTAKEVK